MIRAKGRSLILAAAAALIFTAVPASAQAMLEVWVNSKCSRPLQIAVAVATKYRAWRGMGWWQFKPYEGPERLTSGGEPVLQLETHDFYFYAETTDGSHIYWQGEGFHNVVDGRTYDMIKATPGIVDNHYVITLTCS